MRPAKIESTDVSDDPVVAGPPFCADAQFPALALSCSASGLSAALVLASDSASPSVECWDRPVDAGRSDQLLGLIDQLLQANCVQASRLRHLIVDIGPGAFTALRVACSLAQGILLATDASVDGVWSTEALAVQATEGMGAGRHTVLVAIDARMGEVYCATVLVERDTVGRASGIAEMRPCVVTAPDRVWKDAGPGPSPGPDMPLILAGNAIATLPQMAAATAAAAQAHGWNPLSDRAVASVSADSVAQVGILRLRLGLATRHLCQAAESRIDEPMEFQRSGDSGPVPRYVREKVALDVSEQAAARSLASRG